MHLLQVRPLDRRAFTSEWNRELGKYLWTVGRLRRALALRTVRSSTTFVLDSFYTTSSVEYIQQKVGIWKIDKTA